MKTEKIQTYITPKTTGYVSAAGLGLTLISGISKNKSIKQIHKPLAGVTAVIAAFHIGLIEFYNYKYKHK